MNPVQIRLAIKDYLETKFRIDKWSLHQPDAVQDFSSPPSSGLDLKVSEYSVKALSGWGDDASILVSCRIPFQIVYRFDSSYAYTQIPRDECESMLLDVVSHIESAPNCLGADVKKVHVTGFVDLQEILKGDWLLSVSLSFNIDFNYSALDRGINSPLLAS